MSPVGRLVVRGASVLYPVDIAVLLYAYITRGTLGLY